jgi:cardiolipin synthase
MILHWLTLPTLLTLMRIIFVPFIVYAMVNGNWDAAFILFSIAIITDLLDGLLARLWNEQTALGATLDPLADKLLILSCFFTLAFVHGPLFSIPLWFVIFVLCKELILMSGIALLYWYTGSVPIRPVMLGKIAMVVQTCFIFWLFACYFFHWMPVKTYYGMLGCVIAVVFAALINYIVIGIRWLCGYYHHD